MVASAPGDSVGTLRIEGNYSQTASGRLQIELASPTSFDKLQVYGTMSLAGILDVQLRGGYHPVAGAQFDVLDFVGLTGTFDLPSLPTFDLSLRWDTSKLYTLGILGVTFAGDFNGDLSVDSRDYVLWRKGLGTTYTQNDYAIWRSQFGQTAGSGTGARVNAAIPEPASLTLLMLTATGWCVRRVRAA